MVLDESFSSLKLLEVDDERLQSQDVSWDGGESFQLCGHGGKHVLHRFLGGRCHDGEEVITSSSLIPVN